MRKLGLLFVLLLSFMLIACDKTFGLELPNGVSLVDTNESAEKLTPGKEYQFKVTVPEGFTLKELLVNGEDKKASLVDNQFTVKVDKNTTISVDFIVNKDESGIKKVQFKDDVSSFQLDLDTFKLSDIKIEVVYLDDSKEEVALTKDMISETDFIGLFKTGDSFLDVTYMGKTIQALIQMSSSKVQDELPALVIYSLTNYIDNKTVISFYAMGDFVSYGLLLNQSAASQGIISDHSGVFTYQYKNRTLAVLNNFSDVQSGTKVLFTVSYDQDMDISFDIEESVFYTFLEEVIEVENIRYYTR